MRTIIAGLCAIAALLGSPSADSAKPDPGYVGQALGVLSGDTESNGHGVNNAGSVVGRSAGDGSERAFYWDRATGTMYQLTTSGSMGAAYAISAGSGAAAFAVGYEQAPGEASLAVIWVAPPTAGPIALDASPSLALGVNDNGVAVGAVFFGLPAMWTPAMWTPDGNNGYVRTNISFLPNQVEGYAQDVNNNGIVVGYGYAAVTLAQRGFLRWPDASVMALAPLSGDAESRADAVSDVFTEADVDFVYVTGATRNVNGTERGVRWKVNVDTGVVAAETALSMQYGSAINSVGDVAGARLVRRRQTGMLWRNGDYLELLPPKGGGNTGSFGMSRNATLPTFVVGTTIMRPRTPPFAQAVFWEVN